MQEEVAEAPVAGKSGGEMWQRPHLPTISVMALVRLRRALSNKNVFVNVPGKNSDMVIGAICNRLTENGLLFATAHGRVIAALTALQEKKGMDATNSREILPSMPPLGMSRERLPTMPPLNTPAAAADARAAAAAAAAVLSEHTAPRLIDTEDEEGGELHHMLDPDSGEEASLTSLTSLPPPPSPTCHAPHFPHWSPTCPSCCRPSR